MTPEEVAAMQTEIVSLQDQIDDMVSKLPQLENKKAKE
jgi:hypothetical protein